MLKNEHRKGILRLAIELIWRRRVGACLEPAQAFNAALLERAAGRRYRWVRGAGLVSFDPYTENTSIRRGDAMDNLDIYPEIDLQIAFDTLRQLEQESGDVGGLYWHKVAAILRQADVNRRLLV